MCVMLIIIIFFTVVQKSELLGCENGKFNDSQALHCSYLEIETAENIFAVTIQSIQFSQVRILWKN